MFTHSTVVFFTVLFHLAAVGHLRDSDKLLFLWRSRCEYLLSRLAIAPFPPPASLPTRVTFAKPCRIAAATPPRCRASVACALSARACGELAPA